jgi:hypothetical protein
MINPDALQLVPTPVACQARFPMSTTPKSLPHVGAQFTHHAPISTLSLM